MDPLTNPTISSGSIGSIGGIVGATDSKWLRWTCTTTGNYVFDTRRRGSVAKTSLAAYLLSDAPSNPIVLGDLSVLTYLTNANFSNGYGYEVGSLIAFAATANKIYYIKVTGRNGGEGKFVLSWEPYIAKKLGCTTCSGNLFESSKCIASVSILDVTVDGLYPFGSFPKVAGFYKVSYCSGFAESFAVNGCGEKFSYGGGVAKSIGVLYYGATPSKWSESGIYHEGDIVYTTGDVVGSPILTGAMFIATGTTVPYTPTNFPEDFILRGRRETPFGNPSVDGFEGEIGSYQATFPSGNYRPLTPGDPPYVPGPPLPNYALYLSYAHCSWTGGLYYEISNSRVWNPSSLIAAISACPFG